MTHVIEVSQLSKVYATGKTSPPLEHQHLIGRGRLLAQQVYVAGLHTFD